MKFKFKYVLSSLLSLALLTGCSTSESEVPLDKPIEMIEEIVGQNEASSKNEIFKDLTDTSQAPTVQVGPDTTNHKLIKVDGGDTSGFRQSNVVVNVGFGDREYWAYTNEHGQLVRVTAKEIILQDDSKEPVKNGRYYSKMADVPGVGADTGYDRGHVIADSLGGVANAYNITPQEATLNRHGDQAYMERNIREAGGATDFEAIITYPNAETQIPSKYKISYTIKGNKVVDEFENANPDKKNEELGLTTSKPKVTSKQVQPSKEESNPVPAGDLSSVDTNGNGKVTIKEAKDAGFKMPITKDHWLYQYMDDRDGDGVVGE